MDEEMIAIPKEEYNRLKLCESELNDLRAKLFAAEEAEIERVIMETHARRCLSCIPSPTSIR